MFTLRSSKILLIHSTISLEGLAEALITDKVMP
jgi:hypothetical protein